MLGNAARAVFGGVVVFPVGFVVFCCVGVVDCNQCASSCYPSVVVFRVEYMNRQILFSFPLEGYVAILNVHFELAS